MQHRYVELFYDGPYGSAAPSSGGDPGGWGQGMSAGSSGSMSGGGMGGNNGMQGGNSGGMGMGGAGGMNSVGFPSQMSGADNNDYGAYWNSSRSQWNTTEFFKFALYKSISWNERIV